jgi:hypothetical protein
MRRQNRYDYWESQQPPSSIISRYGQHKNDMYLLSLKDYIQMNLDRIATATLEKELKDLFPQK